MPIFSLEYLSTRSSVPCQKNPLCAKIRSFEEIVFVVKTPSFGNCGDSMSGNSMSEPGGPFEETTSYSNFRECWGGQ